MVITFNGKQVAGIGEWIQASGAIPAADYARFPPQFNPTKFDAVNDFSNWSDASIISKADGGGSDHGAGNTRMIGRASFMLLAWAA